MAVRLGYDEALLAKVAEALARAVRLTKIRAGRRATGSRQPSTGCLKRQIVRAA